MSNESSIVECEVETTAATAATLASEVGRNVDSSQADDRRVIRLVRTRPLLYARNNMPVASYYAQVKRLWQEVADEMGWTVAEVRRKWSHVRNSYSRHLRNEMHGARTGRGRMVSRWYLADELHFLREHMATDTRSSPYLFPTMVEMETEVRSDPMDIKPKLAGISWYGVCASPGAASSGAASPGAAPRSPAPSASRDDDSEDEDAAYFQFFRSIHGDYQQLPGRKQRLFRRQCLALLHELLDEDERPADLSRRSPPDSKVYVIEQIHGQCGSPS